MTKFVKKVIFFVAIFFLFDKIFYPFLMISPTLEMDKRLEHLINGKINKKIIIIGSSRGARNIIAHQIEDSLNLLSYNLSYPGSNINFHEFLLRTLLKFNKKPQSVILAVDAPHELLASKSINFRYERLYPLAKYNYINNELIKRNEKSFLSRFLVLARLNQTNFNLKRTSFSKLDTLRSCGSMPISFQRENRKFNYVHNINDYSVANELPNKVEAFLNFQKLCTSNKINLFIVFSPNYENHNLQLEKRLRQLSPPEVSFIVYDSSNYIYRDPSFFYDEYHLQTNGAVIFTNEIIKNLKTKL